MLLFSWNKNIIIRSMKIRSKESQKWRGRGANSHWCFKSSLETFQKFENRHALPNPGEQELKSKRKDWIPSLKFHETYKNYKWQIGIMKKYHDCWKRVKRAEERKGGGGSSTTHMFFLNQRGKNKHDPGKQSWLLGSTWLLFLWLCVFPKSSSKTKSIFKRKKRKQKKMKKRNKRSESDKVHLAASREGPSGRKSIRNPFQTENMTRFKTVIIIFPLRKIFLLSLFRCWKGQINVFECFSNWKNIQTVKPLPTSAKPNLNNGKTQIETFFQKHDKAFLRWKESLNSFKSKLFKLPHRTWNSVFGT